MSRPSSNAGGSAIYDQGAPRQRIATSELRATLEAVLSRHSRTQRRIVALDRKPSAYSTSFPIDELEVHLDDGTSLRVLFKDLSRHAILKSAAHVKPDFLYNPLREIETYRSILEPARLGTPKFYGALVDQARGRYGLFLEKVSGVELYQVGDLAIWQRVARWLAAMHDRFAAETTALMQAAPLLRYDGDFYSLWPRRAQEFLNQAESARARNAKDRLERVLGNYDRVVERLVALPTTFIHGEFYASNILVQVEGEEQLRVCPVDWEMAAVGPGLIDLAALTAGEWTAEEGETLALAYLEALTPINRPWSGPEEFLLALDYCRLHLAVQWLGWSPGWSPPPEHAQDWLGEATRLAEKLGLS